MPIVDLQRRLHEDGRIRIGEQVATAKGGTRPAAINSFRFTSQNRRAIDAIATEYGGQVEPWDSQWQVTTEATEIPVVVPPEAMSFSQHYELWASGGCQRRCDGEQESISDGPCVCDPDARECRPHTRLSVMLSRYPGTGLWRLDTQGYYAAIELGGAMELVGILTASTRRSVIPGRLRIDHRTVKRPGEPAKQFVVPVLDFDVDIASLATGQFSVPAIAGPNATNSPSIAELKPAIKPVPVDDKPAPPVAEQMAATEHLTRPKRANSAPDIPATGIRPRTAAEAESKVEKAFPGSTNESPQETGEVSTTKQLNFLRIRLKEIGITDNDEVHSVVGAYVGREIKSLKELTKWEASYAIDKAAGAE